MTYFIIRIVVNALAVALTIVLTPGIVLAPDIENSFITLLVYLVLGTVFGLINAFIRPLVLFVTGSLVIWTMGLFTFVINGLLFYLLSIVTPNLMVINSPALLWAILAGAIMGFVVTILEAIFGLDSPVLDDTGKSKFYWRWLGLLPKGRRNRIVENIRLKQVYDIIRRYSIDILVGETPLAGFRRYMQRLLYPTKQVVAEESPPKAVRLMLQDLGPTYVKLGQMMASRSEMLPEEWESELSKLQSEVDPFPYEEAHRIIIEELGSPPEVCFTSFETEPFAAASMAQVYRAKLPEGEDVVVKVERPDIDVTVRGDLNVMRNVVSTLEKRAKWARNFGFSGVVEEFAENVTEELDYDNEAYNARRLKEAMSEFDYVSVPTIYGEYSTSKVITMEYMQGVKITENKAMDAAGINREELARAFIRVINKQVMIDGFFHGDPHPGNVLVDLDTGNIVFLDLGMMGQLTDEERMALFDVIWSLNYGDSQNLTRILLRLSTHFKEIDEGELQQDIDRLVQRYVIYSASTPQLSNVVPVVLNLLFVYGLQLDRSLTIALKSMMQTEELVRTLAPELSFLNAAVEEVQGVMMEQLRGEKIYDGLKEHSLKTAKTLVVNWPRWQRSAAKWAEQLESGQFAVRLDMGDLNKNINQVEKSLNRSVRSLVLALLLVGMLLGSAIVSLAPIQELRFLDFIPYDVFILVFIIAAVLALGYVLFSIWSAWRDRKR
ncbi:MAG: AarF/UbiB family protein [Anaerolineales bacterium]